MNMLSELTGEVRSGQCYVCESVGLVLEATPGEYWKTPLCLECLREGVAKLEEAMLMMGLR